MNQAERYRAARRDPELAVLEGFHTLKHALRFGAQVLEAVTCDHRQVVSLASDLAPDVAGAIAALLEEITTDEFAALAPDPPPTGVVALARRPAADVERVLADPGSAPIVALERPNHLGNVGAVIRVAAAAGAAAVLTTGDRDPWHPAAIRGSAGLHFAQPVARIGEIPTGDRFLVALDPRGAPLGTFQFPDRAMLVFGSERDGLGETLLERADARVSIPMRLGVSSLNLATAVAVVLYRDPTLPGSSGLLSAEFRRDG